MMTKPKADKYKGDSYGPAQPIGKPPKAAGGKGPKAPAAAKALKGGAFGSGQRAMVSGRHHGGNCKASVSAQ